jgi:hypothetical protein
MAGKREQANDEFLEKIQGRSSRAILDYFFSHGICVGRYEFAKAYSLPEHQPVFVPLGIAFAQVNESIKLIHDIGSLSLAAKEKTMRAVYQIEESLRARRGAVEGLASALAKINLAQASVPASPKLWPYAVGGTAFFFFAFFAWPCALIGLVIYSIGAGKLFSFKKRKALADASLRQANIAFDHVVRMELTPRNAFAEA